MGRKNQEEGKTFFLEARGKNLLIMLSLGFIRDGNGVGRGQKMGFSSPPRMVVALPHPRPALGCGAYYLAPSPPLRASRGPALPHHLCIYYHHLFEKHETMCKKKKN